MAKRASKSSKTNDDALSAVEEALKIDFGQEADADSADDPYSDFNYEPEEPTRPARETFAPASAPANDDSRFGSARFAASISKQPSAAAFWFAVIASIIWIAAALWAGYSVIGNDLISLSAWTNFGQTPSLIYFLGSLIIPLLLIWAYAVMIRRSQELKLAARSMTEVAYRLIEP